MGKLVDLYFLTTYTEERLVGKLVNFRLLYSINTPSYCSFLTTYTEEVLVRKASVRARVRVRVRARCARARADQRRGGEGERRGVARPRDAPERPRRAQRARRALPKAGGVPCPSPHSRSSSTSPPCGRCGPRRVGRAVWGGAELWC